MSGDGHSPRSVSRIVTRKSSIGAARLSRFIAACTLVHMISRMRASLVPAYLTYDHARSEYSIWTARFTIAGIVAIHATHGCRFLTSLRPRRFALNSCAYFLRTVEHWLCLRIADLKSVSLVYFIFSSVSSAPDSFPDVAAL